MIYELNKNDFYKCKDLLNENGQLEVKAVIEGINPGRIFVDNIDAPNTGIIWLGNNDGFIFIGNEQNNEFNNQISHFIDSVIVPEAKNVDLDWFEGIGNHPRWNKTIEKLFKHRKLGTWNQKVYTLSKKDYKDNRRPIEEGYTVFKISNSLFDKDTTFIKNIDFLHTKISEYWSSPESFLKLGKGYCIVYNDYIVSICFSGFVVGNVHCIDIETIKEHQGKKLAQCLAHYFVTDCVENDCVPYWDCMEGNKPSVAVAENLGFENRFNYVGYEFQL